MQEATVETVSRKTKANIVFECTGSGSAARQILHLVRLTGKVITPIGIRVYTHNDFGRALELVARLRLEKILSHGIGLAQGPRRLFDVPV